MEYKIYKYTDITPEFYMITPVDVNYNILGLHKKRTVIKGELKTVEYYGEYDETTNTYSDIVLKETRDYHRDENNLIIKRVLTIEWYYLDDTKSPYTKNTIKYYSIDEKIKEGDRRRNNIISSLKLTLFGLLGQANGYDLLSVLTQEMSLYRDGSKSPLITKLQNIQKTYLDNMVPGTNIVIRDYIVNELTF
jgi:hypothetical protein